MMTSLRILTRVAAAVLTVSLGACFPHPPRDMPDASVVRYDGTHALSPDCGALSRPSTLIDGGFHRESMEWGCATYSNLAAQLARPADLVAPLPMGPADAAVAAGAARRYQTGNVRKLDTGTTRDTR